MLCPIHKRFFLTSGTGTGSTPLNAFDQALLNSRVGDFNLIKLSSILPPGCQQIEIGDYKYPPGALIPVAFGAKKEGIKGFIPQGFLSAAVAVGIPKEDARPGLIMETSGFYPDDTTCEERVRNMVLEGMGYRSRSVKKILSISANILCLDIGQAGAVFAAVVLVP